jgi:hypothetical protein
MQPFFSGHKKPTFKHNVALIMQYHYSNNFSSPDKEHSNLQTFCCCSSNAGSLFTQSFFHQKRNTAIFQHSVALVIQYHHPSSPSSPKTDHRNPQHSVVLLKQHC